MEHNDTLRKMRDMKMAGMADAFSEQLADRLVYDKLPAEDRIAMLVDAELDRRRATRLANLVKGAKLRFPDARSESVIYDPKRGLSAESMARYFSCKFVEDAVDIVITGPTGSGKSWLSCAIAMSSCKHFHTTRYTRMPELLGELAAAKDSGRYERVLAKYKKYECLVIDEFVLNVATKEETRDLYELVEGRSQIHSTVFCSQYQEAGWLERLGKGTSAEGGRRPHLQQLVSHRVDRGREHARTHEPGAQMSRVKATVEYLTHDSIAGVAYGLGLTDYDAETERLLLLNHGERAVREAELLVERGCDDWCVQETALRNPLDVAKFVLRKEAVHPGGPFQGCCIPLTRLRRGDLRPCTI